MSYDRRRLRGAHPSACTCVDCEEQRKWQLPRVSKRQQTTASPPSKPPATREDLDRLKGRSSPPKAPAQPPSKPPATREDLDRLKGVGSSPARPDSSEGRSQRQNSVRPGGGIPKQPKAPQRTATPQSPATPPPNRAATRGQANQQSESPSSATQTPSSTGGTPTPNPIRPEENIPPSSASPRTTMRPDRSAVSASRRQARRGSGGGAAPVRFILGIALVAAICLGVYLMAI